MSGPLSTTRRRRAARRARVTAMSSSTVIGSRLIEAAIHVDRLGRDAGRLGQGEEDGQMADLLGLHHPALRHLALVPALENLAARERARLRALGGNAHAR